MDINQTEINAIAHVLTVAFKQAMTPHPQRSIEKFYATFPSSKGTETYPMLMMVDTFREWVGERVFNDLKSAIFTVLNKDWENSVRFDANAIADDSFGFWATIIRQQGSLWPLWKRARLIAVLLANGNTFDGAAMFHATRTYGAHIIKNLWTADLDATSLAAALDPSYSWQFENDVYINPIWTDLVVGPEELRNANQLIHWETEDDGTNNPMMDSVQNVHMWPELSGTYNDHWFLFDNTHPIKALAWQSRKEPDHVFSSLQEITRTREVDAMVSARGEAFFGPPHYAICSTGT